MKKITLVLVSLFVIILAVQSQTVNVIKNPYGNVNWSTYNQYRANYHTHTTNSDGSQSPSEVINEYYSKGYKILSITDHNYTTWPWPNNPGMLAVKGNEYSSSNHMNAMINFTSTSNNLENGIPHVQTNGGIVQINHPGRYNSPSNWSWYIPWFRDYSSCVTLEVFNQGDRYSNDRQLWDNINENYFAQEGKLVWGTSNDDKHNTSHLYGNFNFMLMPDLTEAYFVESISNGAFYFCYEPGRSGDANVPRISNIVVDNNAKTITITATGYNSIQWIGPGTSEVATGNVFDYSAYTNQPFVRAVLDGPNGDSYTQPFGFETVIETNPPTCSISNPANGEIFTAPANVIINANAADSDGTITKVEFFQGSTELGEDLTSPYSYTWSNVAAGTYSLTVKATDNEGAVTTSSAVLITVNGAGGTPIIVSKRIASSIDDVEESQSTGAIYTSSSDIELVYDSYNSQNNQTVGLRFTDLNIPQGATIISASIEFTVDEISSGASSLLIKGHDADNSEVFTTVNNNVSSRPTTAAGINWSPTDWNMVGETKTTPDISGIIQEIVNRTGYSFNSAISIIITGTGTRIAEAFDGDGGSAALVQIEYTMESNTPPVFASDPFSKGNALEDQPYNESIAGDASDPDGDDLSFLKVSGPAWLAISANGGLSGTPANSDVGANNWIVEVNDSNGGTDQATMQITVDNTNDHPIFTTNPVVEPDANVDELYSSSIADNATDEDGDALTFTKNTGPNWLTISDDGTISGTPSSTDIGPNSWEVEVNDGNGGTGYAILEIEVVDPINVIYCESHGYAVNEWIDRVTIGDESYQSGTSDAAGYQDLIGSFTFTFVSGSENNVTATPGFSPRSKFEYWNIWIDFNADGDFEDSGELVFTASKKKSDASGIITIPNILPVQTIMRVSMKRGSLPTSCEIFTLGEVEDYAVSIINGGAQPPAADFVANNNTIPVGGMVDFTDLSTNDPETWLWTFDGGTPTSSSSQNPTVTYNTIGTYSVSLTATNIAGSDTETKTNYINVTVLPEPPVADFSAYPRTIITGESVQFTDQSTGGNPTSWLWDFGDNATSTLQNPLHTYNTAGDYTVSLTTSNAVGTDVETKVGFITVEVNTSYCASSSTSNEYDWIWGVEIGSYSYLNNGVNMYSDYTGEVIDLTPGASVDLVLTPGFANKSQREFWRIWIDYNGDADFSDSGEQVFAANNKKSTVLGSFTLPSQLSGQTRMRISMKNGGAPGSCEIFTYGEVEDYTVNFGNENRGEEVVMGGSSVDEIAEKSVFVYPNPVKDKLYIRFDKWIGEKKINFYDMTGRSVYHAKTSADYLELDVSFIKKGIYLFVVKDYNTSMRKKIFIQ